MNANGSPQMLNFKRDKSKAVESFAPNALVAREWRARWRDKRSFGLVLAYVALLAWMVAWRYQNALAALSYSPLIPSPPASAAAGALLLDHEYSWDGMALIGREIFRALSWWQTLGWMVLAPTLTSSALAGERERGLLEGLQLSRLSAWQIVGGKLSSALIFALVLSVATWPIMAVCLLMGGVSPQELMLSLGLQGVTILGCATLGLFFSARCRRAGTALRATLVTLTLWGVGSYLAYFVTQRGVAGNLWSALARIYGSTNPVVAALSIGDPLAVALGLGGRPLTQPSWSLAPAALSAIATIAPYVISPLFQLVFIPILLLYATRALHKPFPEQYWIERAPRMSTHVATQTSANGAVANGAAANGATANGAVVPEPKRGGEPWWEIPFARWIHFSNPVLQREMRGKFRMRRVPRAVIIFEIVLAVFVGGFGCWAVWLALSDASSRITIWTVLALTGLVMVMMTAPMIGASAWSHERESGTFEPLMLSLLPSRDIVWGKMAGSLLANAAFGLPMYPLLALCVRGLSYDRMGQRGVSLSQALATLFLLAATAWCYTALGMLISWRHNRSASAAGWTMSAVLAMNILLPLVLRRLGSGGDHMASLAQPLSGLLKIITPLPSTSPVASGEFDWVGTTIFLFLFGALLLAILLRAMRRRATQN